MNPFDSPPPTRPAAAREIEIIRTVLARLPDWSLGRFHLERVLDEVLETPGYGAMSAESRFRLVLELLARGLS